jgi:hypothetical protein
MIVAASPAQKTIVDLFIEAPTTVVAESAADRRAAITVSDVKNGYLEAHLGSKDEAPSSYIAVLWESTRGPLLGISHEQGDSYGVQFFLVADRWRNVTAEVFPVTMHEIAMAYHAKKLGEIDEQAGFASPLWLAQLPRIGTSIRIVAPADNLPPKADPLLLTLSFDHTKFVIDGVKTAH